jgi:hypothetical protein
MTCQELSSGLLQRWRGASRTGLLRKLMHKCGAFGAEALKALAKKAVQAAVSKAWALYRGAVISGKDSAVAYGQAVQMIWSLWNWYDFDCALPRRPRHLRGRSRGKVQVASQVALSSYASNGG